MSFLAKSNLFKNSNVVVFWVKEICFAIAAQPNFYDPNRQIAPGTVTFPLKYDMVKQFRDQVYLQQAKIVYKS